MYLVFKVHKRGYPINEIYETEVKPISTRRFNQDLLDKDASEDLETKNERGDDYISFDGEASFDPLPNTNEKKEHKEKPENVPALNLEGLPEYVTTSEEED